MVQMLIAAILGAMFYLKGIWWRIKSFFSSKKDRIYPKMSLRTDQHQDPSSFRDPAGFIFTYQNKLYRQVNAAGAADYDLLMSSGLYAELTRRQWLVQHEEETDAALIPDEAHKVLLPEQIPHISYPYEWSFHMFKDAAVLTLQIALLAIKHGMTLKDATPFNIQFYKGKPLFIDTLSFERYVPGKPWVAYRQFCEMFAGPLVLAQYNGNAALRFLQTFIDGIPVQQVAKMLPFRSYFNGLCLLDFHLQSLVVSKSVSSNKGYQFSKGKYVNLLRHLKQGFAGLKGPKGKTTWDDYYDVTIASDTYLAEKDRLFREFLSAVEAETAIDLGANNGYFFFIMAEKGMQVTATDFDSNSIDHLYQRMQKEGIKNVLPLIVDLTNPSPAIGWGNKERSAFITRAA